MSRSQLRASSHGVGDLDAPFKGDIVLIKRENQPLRSTLRSKAAEGDAQRRPSCVRFVRCPRLRHSPRLAVDQFASVV